MKFSFSKRHFMFFIVLALISLIYHRITTQYIFSIDTSRLQPIFKDNYQPIVNVQNPARTVTFDDLQKHLSFFEIKSPFSSGIVDGIHNHVVLIFDSKRTQNAIGALNSLIAISKHEKFQLPSVHLVTTASQQARIKSSWDLFKEFENRIHFYDFDKCKTLVMEARTFSPNIHISAHCKFYLQLILPMHVRSALFIDNDVAFVGNLQHCMPQMKEGEMISMAPDMGDVCLSQPERCWPTGFVARVPPNLHCGNDILKSKKPVNGSCPSLGQIVPYHFNGGVVFLNLEQMRKADFRTLYEEHIWRRFYSQGLRPAEWGEQCYINSFFSAYPKTLQQMPCSCNYQFTGVRRRVICPNQPVVIVHAWKYGLNTKDPYSRYIGHFMECKGEACFTNIPQVRKISDSINTDTTAYVPFKGKSELSIAPLKKPMFSIITRTADRPNMIQAAISSIQNQVYQNFVHIIGIELDNDSADYITQVPDKTIVIRMERSAPIDAEEACRACHSQPGKCLNAPPMSEPKKREEFLRCFCNLSFPSNGAFEILHTHVAPDSYVIYLDDDNMIIEPSALLKMANVIAMTPDSENTLFIAASHLGRITPTPGAMRFKTILQGDMDASNLVFHASHIPKTEWGRKRCGDWRTAKNLHGALKSVWILQFMLIAANPYRDSSTGAQGGGMRQDGHKISVLITSMSNQGFRADWLYRTIYLFLSDPYKHIVGEVILIWNNPVEAPPVLPPSTRVFRMKKNSLNNRWTVGLNAAKYNKVLNMDDDMEVSLPAIMCMFHTLRSRPGAIVGPYVRYFEPDGKYSMSEQRDYGLPFRMILPRALMAEKSTLMVYSHWTQFFPYVDDQEAHCDDVLLNMAVVHNKGEVIRVALPPKSVGDYWQSCMHEEGVKKGGLSGQENRSKLRMECIQEFLKQIPLPPSKTRVVQCANYGLMAGQSVQGYSSEIYTSSIYLPECS